MSSAGQASRPKRRWSWVWVVLVISLAINLAIAAAVLTHTFFGSHKRHHHRITGPGYTQVLPRAFFRQLEHDRREELVDGLRQHRREFRGLRKDLREKARAIATALRAEPFDQGRLEQSMAEFENASGSMINRGGEIARGLFARLTPQERKLMADEIERKSMSRKRWKRLRERRGRDKRDED